MDPATPLAHTPSPGTTGARTLDGETDARLLACFAALEGRESEQAFAVLVRRHGPMVLRTCRAILRDEHAAEDALQATFLVLTRRTPMLRVRDSLGPWLHQVACRVSWAARAAAARRACYERKAAEMTPREVSDWEPDDAEHLLHQEVSRLPERYRRPVVLCYLEGLTSEQAANLLGWPVGTVRSRLARARERLRTRLVRRGVALSAGLLGASLAGGGIPTPLSAHLVEATVSTAVLGVRGGAVPATVGELACDEIASAPPTVRRAAIMGLLACGMLAFLLTVWLWIARRPAAFPRAPRRAATVLPWTELLAAPKRAIWSLALTADGKRLFSGHDESLRSWDLADRRALFQVDRSCRVVRRVDVTPDGRLVVCAENACDRTTADQFVVTVRDGTSGRVRRTLLGHDAVITDAVVSPDGTLIASVDANDREIQLWNAASGRPTGALKGHERVVNAVIFSPDGKTLASCGRDQKVRLWDVATRTQRRVLRGHRDAVESLAFSPDGRWIVSGSNDRTIRIWDAANGVLRDTLALTGVGLAVAFGPDSRTIAVISNAGRADGFETAPSDLVLWNLARPHEALTVAADSDSIFRMIFTPDGRSLITGGRDGSIRVGDTSVLPFP